MDCGRNGIAWNRGGDEKLNVAKNLFFAGLLFTAGLSVGWYLASPDRKALDSRLEQESAKLAEAGQRLDQLKLESEKAIGELRKQLESSQRSVVGAIGSVDKSGGLLDDLVGELERGIKLSARLQEIVGH